MTAQVETAIEFSAHARQRYRERVGPEVDDARLRQHLAEIARHGELTTHPPRWFAERARAVSALYLVIGDVMFPLVERPDGRGWLAKTCIARGGISRLARTRRNRNRVAHGRRAPRRRR